MRIDIVNEASRQLKSTTTLVLPANNKLSRFMCPLLLPPLARSHTFTPSEPALAVVVVLVIPSPRIIMILLFIKVPHLNESEQKKVTCQTSGDAGKVACTHY